MTRSQDASSPAGDPAGGERIVIRDKRKVTPGGGKLAESVSSQGQAAAPAAASAAAPEAAAAKSAAPEDADAGAPAGDAVEGSVIEGDVVQDEAAQNAASTATSTEGDARRTGTADAVQEAEPEMDVSSIAGPAVELAVIRRALEERTADLQRMTAEYANYRKRVERDRTVSAEQATGVVLAALLPMLDDLDRAREHGDLTGPFASVAEQLNVVVAKFGLVAFGAKGDLFDPNRHEAVAHLPSAEVTEPTCIDVMRRGYLLGERLLRPAMVAVAAPE